MYFLSHKQLKILPHRIGIRQRHKSGLPACLQNQQGLGCSWTKNTTPDGAATKGATVP
jgi:hypothetical protein